jgi:hypothetical protein
MNKRTQERIDNNLGIIRPGQKSKKYRNQELKKIADYYENSQYDHLSNWDEAECSESYIPIMKRKPKIIYTLPEIIVDRLTSKLVGSNVFPSMTIEDDEDTTFLIGLIQDATSFKSKILQAVKKYVAFGSAFIRFKFVEGQPVIEHYNSMYCYPEFNDAGELLSIEIKYVYEDWEDLDERGKPIEKWYKLYLGQMFDVIYDNPKFSADGNDPIFSEISRNEHELGFVQGEWLKTTDERHGPDGKGIIKPIFDLVDSINYNLSGTDKATTYGLDPQPVFSGLTEEELEDLIKSSSKGWALGRDGNANFLEVGGAGVQRAHETLSIFDKKAQDTARVLILDPEKIVGSAQSAKAMEVLHGPMIELIYELRPGLEKSITSLLTKITMACLIYNFRGFGLTITMPKQYKPKSMQIKVSWGEIFPKTMMDLQQKVQTAAAAANANLISRETAIRFIAKDFNVENIELELEKINTQPRFNTWGF